MCKPVTYTNQMTMLASWQSTEVNTPNTVMGTPQAPLLQLGLRIFDRYEKTFDLDPWTINVLLTV